jgi:hypothetical protein
VGFDSVNIESDFYRRMFDLIFYMELLKQRHSRGKVLEVHAVDTCGIFFAHPTDMMGRAAGSTSQACRTRPKFGPGPDSSKPIQTV